LGERFEDSWAHDIVQVEENEFERKLAEKERLAALRRKREEEEARQFKLKQEEQMKRAKQIIAEAAATKAEPALSLKVGGYDVLPVLFWGGVGAAVLLASRALFVATTKRGRGEGKWVYDRSLGGKKVWVPTGSSPGAVERPAIADAEFDRLASIAAAAGSKVDEGARTFVLPSWWNPAPVLYAAPGVKAAKQADAERLLSRIESTKVAGQDYNVRDIVLLREICKEGQVSVKPKTVGARDAIYTAAVDAAIQTAMEPMGSQAVDMGEDMATRFVSALANDLGLPEERAVSIVQASVAKASRARLLEAVAALKADNETEAVMALIRLAALLEKLPVLGGQGGAQADLIASSLQASSSVEERTKIFYLIGQLYLEGAALVASMLGFDPALVMPRLSADMEEAQRAAR